MKMTKTLFTAALLSLSALMTGCSTLPEGVSRFEMLFGAADPATEATLVCLRYPSYYPNCDVPKIRMIGETAFGYDQDCKAFTEKVTEVAKDWGFTEVSYLFIPSKENGRPHHVVPVIKTGDKEYVLEKNFQNGRSYYTWMGEVSEYLEFTGTKDYLAINRPFEGDEARKYDKPVTVLDAVRDANGGFDGFLSSQR